MWRKRSLDNDEDWSVSEGVYEGKPIILRVDQGAASLAGDSDLSIQIGIAVPFIEPTDEGFPPAQEQEALESVEESIIRHAGHKVRLVAVITTDGVREFVLYTGTADWIPGFHQTLRESSTLEVEMIANSDPDWTVYKQLSATH